MLFVMGANGTGGTELQARALITGLRARKVPVSVLLLDAAHGLEGLPSDTCVVANQRPHSVSTFFTYVSVIRRIRRRLKAGEFDVIHAVHARGYVVSALAAIGLHKVRRVAWRRNLGIHLHGRRSLLPKLLERVALKATDVVLVNSADVRDYWVSQHGLSPAKVLLVPNLLQRWRFDVQRSPSAGSPQIVAVGGLRSVKGHSNLLRAASLLNRPAEVVIVGEGDHRSALETEARELGIKLTLPGVQSDPRPWLSTASLYAHPSISEGSSNAVLEAMAAGLPIVASDVGGMREMLGDTGVLVPPGDVKRLSRAMSGLLDEPDRAQRLGDAARKRAEDCFSEDAVIETTIRIYRGEQPCVAS